MLAAMEMMSKVGYASRTFLSLDPDPIDCASIDPKFTTLMLIHKLCQPF
jgi:hypothetical protein